MVRRHEGEPQQGQWGQALPEAGQEGVLPV